MENQENLGQVPEQNQNKSTKKNLFALLILGGLFSLLAFAVFLTLIVFIFIQNRAILSTLNKINDTINGVAAPINISLPDSAPFLGNKDAKVTIVEYADYQCPYCEQFFKESFPQIKTQYIDTGKVKFYYQDFAFLGEESILAAQAAKCSLDQGKFWEYHDYLFNHQNGENQGAFAAVHLKEFAKAIGLDQTAFDSCLDSQKYLNAVTDESTKAQNYGVNSTPTVFINGKKLEGAGDFASFASLIEAELNK